MLRKDRDDLLWNVISREKQIKFSWREKLAVIRRENETTAKAGQLLQKRYAAR